MTPSQNAASALAAGDWAAARTCFELALRRKESPEALFGLGTTLWWLGETDAAVRTQERAYVAFCRRPDPPSAGLVAISLALIYHASLGNHAASRGWVGRLERLVERYDLAALRGWAELCRAVAANDVSELTVAEALARDALDVARRTGDSDLELCALSEIGTALVQAGKVGDGGAFFDEAMAGALGGEARRLETVVFTACRSIVGCSRALQVDRARLWIRAAGDFTRRYGAPHLYMTCRTQYGAVLFALGQWEGAERELRAALRIGQSAERSLYGEALAKLAELRVAQGRLEEAAELLDGFEDHVAAAYPRAQIHLCRNEPEVAAAILDRRLDGLGEDCLHAVPLCELRAEVDLALSDVEAATGRAQRLVKLGEATRCQMVTAHGERAYGCALLAERNSEPAVHRLGRALDVFCQMEMPFEAARTHLLLARAFGDHQPASVVVEARSALRTFDQLGASGAADEAAAHLRRFGVRAARSGPRGAPMFTRREQEVC